MNADEPAGDSGTGIIRASDAATAVFVTVAVASAFFLEQFKVVVVVVSLSLFAVGCAAFLWAFALAVGRSRTDAMGIGGLFFLQGTAPRPVQLRLVGAVVVQSAVALATAAAHPFTSQAFVILAPMFGLGLAGLWGARHGRFDLRDDDARHRPDRSSRPLPDGDDGGYG